MEKLYLNHHRLACAVFPWLIISLLFFCFPLFSLAVCNHPMADYLAYPPFLTSKVKPNVLLILDNSTSMNNYAYREIRGSRAGTLAWTGYDPGKEYYGLFDPNKCYSYDRSNHYFYEDGDTVDDPTTPSIVERSTGSDPTIRKFSGNWLNWWTMRRLDVAKKVLTGGRIAPNTTDTVLEAMPTERDQRKIFNDYTTADDPHNILTGVHAKNVYYTPFHRGIYSWFYNIDRHEKLGGGAGEYAIMFNALAADFDQASDLTGGSRVEVVFTDPIDGSHKSWTQLGNDPSEAGTNLGEVGSAIYDHDYYGYVVAVKVESDDLPVQGIVQKMADRVRFGYMQFNSGKGPNEGHTWNAECTSESYPWDIDGDGTADLRNYYADGGRVRNYIGDTATCTDPHGSTVLQIIDNINRQNVQIDTPIGESLWEAVQYFRQDSPEYLPESSPVSPPANNIDFEENNSWDPYYFNNFSDFIPCAKSSIILVSDGAPTSDHPPSATWPSGGAATFNGNSSGLIDDIAFNMHTQDLRTALSGDQTITFYSVFCFDDTNSSRLLMMRAARAGGFIDENGDGEPGGSITSDPDNFGSDPEWDKDGDNVPDTYFEAQNGQEMEEKIMLAIADILSRTASGTAASVISNSRGGEGAIYQAVFYTESEAEPLTGDTVNWYGSIHSLFLDSHGNMREDSNGNHALDLGADKIVKFDGETAKAKLYTYDPMTETETFDSEVEINELHFIWDALSQLSSPTLDVTHQRTYSSNPTPFQRYIFTDYIDTSQPVSTSNVDSSQTMDFLPDFVDDAANDNYFFLNPDLLYDDDGNPSTPDVGLTETEMIEEAKKIIRYIRGEEGLTETGTGFHYRNRTLDTDGDGTDDTVYRLGDIVHSTPTVVSRPAENYDLLYNDSSYLAFKKKYAKRRSVVYAGANDGMLHAFNGGFYDRSNQKFITQPLKWDAGSSAWIPDTSYTNYSLGAELWAYVPNALLPHLRWLKEPLSDNTHVYYVDLKPRVFDARIFFQADGVTPLDSNHPYGWGTVLLGGMRFGGAPIGVDTDNDGTCDLTFTSAYFALDITNPESPPRLLWSFTDSNLGFTTSYPTPIRVGDKWFIVIGSGPADFQATRKDDGIHFTKYGGSLRTASVYILNADDGSVAQTFSMDSHSFMADPIAADFDLATSGGEYDREWSGEAVYIASDGCGA